MKNIKEIKALEKLPNYFPLNLRLFSVLSLTTTISFK